MSLVNSKLFTKFLFWAMAEIVLNFVGLDDLADYSEFLSEKHHYKPTEVEEYSIMTPPVRQAVLLYSYKTSLT